MGLRDIVVVECNEQVYAGHNRMWLEFGPEFDRYVDPILGVMARTWTSETFAEVLEEAMGHRHFSVFRVFGNGWEHIHRSRYDAHARNYILQAINRNSRADEVLSLRYGSYGSTEWMNLKFARDPLPYVAQLIAGPAPARRFLRQNGLVADGKRLYALATKL